MMSRSTISSTRFKRKRKRRAKVRIILAVLSVILILASLSYVSRSEQLTASVIEVRGNSLASTEEITAIVREKMDDSFLLLFSRNSWLLFSRASAEKEILASTPKVKKADVEFDGLDTIVVSVEERKPKALWCVPASEESPEECYFLDTAGFAFQKAPLYTGAVHTRFFSEQTPQPSLIGKTIMPAEDFDRASRFLEFIRGRSFTPASATLDENGDITVSVEEGGRIIFNPKADLLTLLENFEAAIREESVVKNGVFAVLYIDLRFGNKIFYKPVE